jgi:hypothetical protein
MNTSYEAPYYVVCSSLLLLLPSFLQYYVVTQPQFLFSLQCTKERFKSIQNKMRNTAFTL